MLLKRRTYGLAIGLVLSQLSIASYLNHRTAQRFGDCADCRPAKEIPFPLDNSGRSLTDVVSGINAKLASGSVTAFTHGNGLNTAMPSSLHSIPQQLAAVNADMATRMPQPAPQPPLVVPQFQPIPQSRIDALFPSDWMQRCMGLVPPAVTPVYPALPSRFLFPNASAYFSPAAGYWRI